MHVVTNQTINYKQHLDGHRHSSSQNGPWETSKGDVATLWLGGGYWIQESSEKCRLHQPPPQHHHKQHSCGKLEFMQDAGAVQHDNTYTILCPSRKAVSGRLHGKWAREYGLIQGAKG